MVAVVQLVEHQVVILDVAGSSPVSHPMRPGSSLPGLLSLDTTSSPFRPRGRSHRVDVTAPQAPASPRPSAPRPLGADQPWADKIIRNTLHHDIFRESSATRASNSRAPMVPGSRARRPRGLPHVVRQAPSSGLRRSRCRPSTAPTECSSHPGRRYPATGSRRCSRSPRCRHAWCSRRTTARCWY